MNFLPIFFDFLHEHNIGYCVLRNHHFLPESTEGSDLDILINKSDREFFFGALTSAAERSNGRIVSIISSDICPRICVAGVCEEGWGLMIDLHYDKILYREQTVISNKQIWNNTITSRNGISVLDRKADALVRLFKELLNNGTCSKKYYEDFKEILKEESFLKSVFFDIGKQEIIPELLVFKKKGYSFKEIHRLYEVLNRFFPRRSHFVRGDFRKMNRLLKQPGYSIAFLGPDGAGKSTVIDNLKPFLSGAFHNSVYIEHMRPNLFPSLARVMRKEMSATPDPEPDPHGSASSGFVGSLLRWGYYFLDYSFGYFLKVWPKKAIRSCVWIFDRYYYDYLIDSRRARIHLPKWVLKLGQRIIPEPDLILCLGADAVSIHERKPELPMEEVERQVKQLKIFCMNHRRAVWIDTGKNIKDSSIDATTAIIKVMAKRFESVDLTER